MKKIFILALLALFSMSTSVFASSAAEEMCQSAVMATGKDSGYAYGFCIGTSYSVAKWACVLGYTSQGKDVSYGLGACYNR